MSDQLLCPLHGPFDATYGTCPYCAGTHNRPVPPPPLSNYSPAYNQPGGRRSVPVAGHELDTQTQVDEEEKIGPLAILWVKSGARRGQIYKIDANTIIGRKEGQLLLEDPKVSNPQAKFTLENNEFVLWDFASKNGTFVNGERIRGATALKENDEVKFGDTVFVFKMLP